MIFTDQQLEEMKNEIISLLRSTNRPGIENVIKYLTEQSDYFYAPSSVQYHSNMKGGLCFHSLCVLKAARKIHQNMLELALPEKQSEKITDESIIICCLLHDICKTNFYYPEEKFYKDNTNHWVKYGSYTINDKKFPMGHGEKSTIMLLALGLKLSAQEMCAIRFHMGLTDPGMYISQYTKSSMMEAINSIPLVYLLMLSDGFASFLMEQTVNHKLECILP